MSPTCPARTKTGYTSCASTSSPKTDAFRLRVGENSVTALAEHGIECLRQIIPDERAAGVPSGASEVPSGDRWRSPLRRRALPEPAKS